MSKFIYDPQTVGKHTIFNQQMSDMYDIPAREKVKTALGDFVIDNPVLNKQDMVITDPQCKYRFLELQVCTSWINNFPYPNVYIYARKYKYNHNTLFLTLNKYMDKGYIFDMASLDNVKPTRLRKWSREFIYNVPWNRVMYVEMADLDKETVMLY